MLFSLSLVSLLIFYFFYNIFQIYFMIFCLGVVYFINFLMVCLVGSYAANTIFVYFDTISVLLFGLTYFIILVLFLMNYCEKSFYFCFNFVIMEVSLGYCLFSFSLLNMYVFFEFSIVPLVLMMMYKGCNEERFEASVYLLLYTVFSSLLFLVMLVFMNNFSFCFFEAGLLIFGTSKGIFWMVMFLVFLVKMPVYCVHSWLSKAHVEAPVEGSMLLAGVLLKLGCFGFYRLLFYLGFESCKSYINFLIFFSILGSFVSCLVCMRQVDIKLMIAYSSVSHMGVLLAGLMSFLSFGWIGGVAMMLSHGFCSSILFFLANMFYTRVGSRNLLLMKGLLSYFPVTLNFWLIFCALNMGTPPSMNFFSEILLLVSVFKKSLISALVICPYLFLVVYYSLILFLRMAHGQSWGFFYMKKESFMEMLVIFVHTAMSLLFIFDSVVFFSI